MTPAAGMMGHRKKGVLNMRERDVGIFENILPL